MMNKKFGVTFEGYGKVKTLCLVALSDAWRRKAEFDNPQVASVFNKHAMKLCAAVQWFDQPNDWPKKSARRAFRNIVNLAQAEGIERVILPVYKDSPIGEFVTKQFLKNYGGPVDVELQEHPYTSRLHHLGTVDKRRKTALDFGMAYVVD